jgi:DNA-directed RNA polymerase beta subunit
MCNCNLCKRGYKLKDNSIKKVLNNNIDKRIIQEANNYSMYSELYDKNNLSSLLVLKRKINNYKL